MNDAPIGVFDSGMGGISVLKSMVKLIPNENYIYYGDSAHAPYGTKSAETILERSFKITEKLISEGAKAIVIACNTATSVSAESIRAKYTEIPIIGIEPAVKPAVTEHRGGRIIVMATEVTLKRKKFKELMDRYSTISELIPMPCPELVNYVESDQMNSENVKIYLKERFSEVGDKKIDAVVLGCTHFPFLSSQIQDVAGYDVRLYESSEGISHELGRKLEEYDIRTSERERKGSVILMNSGGEKYLKLSRSLLFSK